MQVAIEPCNDYDSDNVLAAARAMMDSLGGIGQFVKPGMRVYIKPNMVAKASPAEAKTTHPAVVAAFIRLARQAGASEVLVGDCPGGPGFREEDILRAYRVCGYQEAAEREGAVLVVNREKVVRAVPNGAVAKSFELVSEMMDADVLINICKAKTHALCAMTGAVKNLYGVIYGMDKSKYHAVYSRPTSFNQFLIDIAETVKPAFSVMDGIVGMEGPGPTAGVPRKLGVLLASASPYALDAVAVKLMGWKQSDVLMLELARERGLLPSRLEDIPTVGIGLEGIAKPDRRPFKKPTMTGQATKRLQRLLPKVLREALDAHPVLNAGACVGCGECDRACPPHAIHMQDRKPIIDYDLCIHCFCCQELCPAKAMEARKGFIKRR